MPLSSPPRHQPGADAWRKRRPGAEPRRCHSTARGQGTRTARPRPLLLLLEGCRRCHHHPASSQDVFLLQGTKYSAQSLRGAAAFRGIYSCRRAPRTHGMERLESHREGQDAARACRREAQGGPCLVPKIHPPGSTAPSPEAQHPSCCSVVIIPGAIRRSPQPFPGDFSPEQNQTQMPKTPQGDSPGETPKFTVLAQKLTPPAAEMQDAEPFLLPQPQLRSLCGRDKSQFLPRLSPAEAGCCTHTAWLGFVPSLPKIREEPHLLQMWSALPLRGSIHRDVCAPLGTIQPLVAPTSS